MKWFPSGPLQRFFFEAFYFRHPPWDTGISPPELEAFAQTHAAGRALDLGCGTGTNAIFLARLGWQVTGVDFAARAIRSARAKAREAGVQVDFRRGDVTRLDDVHGPFDLILDIGCFHSLPEGAKQVYLDNLERLLAPQGTFLLYALLREAENQGQAVGLLPRELKALEKRLALVERQDGSYRGRASAWMSFHKAGPP